MINFYEAKDKILPAIERIFLKNYYAVKDEKYRKYYWKWVSTRDVANEIKWPLTLTRYWLNRLAKVGLVIKKSNYSNWSSWTLPQIKGFKQHKYKDYLEKANVQS